MVKNIVICSDGTGNTATKGRGTNVFKIFEGIDTNGHLQNNRLPRQIGFYDDGVGTEQLKTLKLLGGAIGWGLSRNIKELYADLVRSYELGDRIYLFGYSRGAFTVRTLAGFVGTCGILRRDQFKTDAALRDAVRHAYREYRRAYWPEYLRHFFHRGDREQSAAAFRQQHSLVDPQHAPGGKVPIEFIGVWDTVDAVGLPFDHLADFINNFIYRFKFPDHRLGEHVRKACHALSIDDERKAFHPLLWDGASAAPERIEQVWFPGVHSNVGGGQPKQGMALVALDWMMHKAEASGLRFIDFDRAYVREHKNPNDKLFDSRGGLKAYYRYSPRDIGAMCDAAHIAPKLHESAIDRILQGTDGYAPGNFPTKLEFVATPGTPETLVQLSNAVSATLTEYGSLLSHTRMLITLRRFAHHALFAITVVALYFILRSGRMSLFDLTSFIGLLKAGKLLLLHYKPILIFLAVFYGLGQLGQYLMNRVFSEFWHSLVSRIQAGLPKPIAHPPTEDKPSWFTKLTRLGSS